MAVRRKHKKGNILERQELLVQRLSSEVPELLIDNHLGEHSPEKDCCCGQ